MMPRDEIKQRLSQELVLFEEKSTTRESGIKN